LTAAFVDTNVLIRHFTGDPPRLARRATRFLAGAERLLLTDVVFAECVYVLESFYEVAPERVAELMRAAIALPAMEVADEPILTRALEVYERHGLHFADAYLVASAEVHSPTAIASFDRGLDRLGTVARVEP
jgi:predicted nucleic acid-binding protein